MKQIQVTGKRKNAVARAILKQGTGKIKINKFDLNLFKPELLKMRITEPLVLAGEVANKVDINVNVYGGGVHGQAEAIRLTIGKALVQYDKKLKKTFLDYDRHLLVGDIRRKEQYKPNDSKARAKRQKSYR